MRTLLARINERSSTRRECVHRLNAPGQFPDAVDTALAGETLQTGKHYVFLAGCECPLGYIIRTEADGAHMKRWGEPAAIEAAYEEWPGEEFAINDANGVCFFKEEQA